ncbi:EcsC family protein [Paratractidigestivibacter sp.]|uniref:EcsC family protein n=1 Tax=Paratractidigestivibacter sp. TaxID=2847316 RepID=UPI002AC8C822|nr:EcsC family protein [Paratractidigestivibacter sp.]
MSDLEKHPRNNPDLLKGVQNFADAAGKAAAAAGGAVADAASAGAEAAVAGAKRVHQAFGGEYGDEIESNVKQEDGTYVLPSPLIDSREDADIQFIKDRYERLTSPGLLAKAGEKISAAVPKEVTSFVSQAGDAAKEAWNGLSEQELMQRAIKVAADGFGELEKQAAKATVSKEYVLQRINEGKQSQKVSDLSEICLLRAYDVAAVTANERLQHMGIALVEGGGTGAAGFWGLPANLALSMLIYFRAVQSVAMFYGYDVKDDPAELVIASEVFSEALAPGAHGGMQTDLVGKLLVYAEAAGIQQAAKKSWSAMVAQGGAALLIAQTRALANGAARKAVEKGGRKALEVGVFKNALKQVGKQLSLKTVGKAIPFIGAGFGALFDTAQMSKILEFADLYYHKRFIVEKPARIDALFGKVDEVEAEIPEELVEELADDIVEAEDGSED